MENFEINSNLNFKSHYMYLTAKYIYRINIKFLYFWHTYLYNIHIDHGCCLGFCVYIVDICMQESLFDNIVIHVQT